MILGTYSVVVEGDRLTLTNDRGTYSIPIAAWQRKPLEEIYKAAMEDARCQHPSPEVQS